LHLSARAHKNTIYMENIDQENPHGIRPFGRADWPELLQHINDPPKQLYYRGTLPYPKAHFLTVIGSRNPTRYGTDIVRRLIMGLVGQPIVIVSGLAIGIDGMAHEAALEAGLKTISFPGSSLDDEWLYPAKHRTLADRIIENGGCLISEYAHGQGGTDWTFPKRNRLMAGCSQATLIIEGGAKSGSLITTDRALDYNRSILAVPGPIDSAVSVGPNRLIRVGAIPILSPDDILQEYRLEPNQPIAVISAERLAALDPLSRRIVDILGNGEKNKDSLSRELGVEMTELNATISFLEIDGLVKASGNLVRRVG
jgi:DNA processing protein